MYWSESIDDRSLKVVIDPFLEIILKCRVEPSLVAYPRVQLFSACPRLALTKEVAITIAVVILENSFMVQLDCFLLLVSRLNAS